MHQRAAREGSDTRELQRECGRSLLNQRFTFRVTRGMTPNAICETSRSLPYVAAGYLHKVQAGAEGCRPTLVQGLPQRLVA